MDGEPIALFDIPDGFDSDSDYIDALLGAQGEGVRTVGADILSALESSVEYQTERLRNVKHKLGNALRKSVNHQSHSLQLATDVVQSGIDKRLDAQRSALTYAASGASLMAPAVARGISPEVGEIACHNGDCPAGRVPGLTPPVEPPLLPPLNGVSMLPPPEFVPPVNGLLPPLEFPPPGLEPPFLLPPVAPPGMCPVPGPICPSPPVTIVSPPYPPIPPISVTTLISLILPYLPPAIVAQLIEFAITLPPIEITLPPITVTIPPLDKPLVPVVGGAGRATCPPGDLTKELRGLPISRQAPYFPDDDGSAYVGSDAAKWMMTRQLAAESPIGRVLAILCEKDWQYTLFPME